MNRINPLYILFLILTLTLISFSLLNGEKTNFNNKIKELNSFEKIALKYNTLKKDWHNKKEIEQQINFIVKDTKFKNANFVTSFGEKNAIIKLKSADKQTINYFVTKLLNKKLRIKKMNITNSMVVVEVILK